MVVNLKDRETLTYGIFAPDNHKLFLLYQMESLKARSIQEAISLGMAVQDLLYFPNLKDISPPTGIPCFMEESIYLENMGPVYRDMKLKEDEIRRKLIQSNSTEEADMLVIDVFANLSSFQFSEPMSLPTLSSNYRSKTRAQGLKEHQYTEFVQSFEKATHGILHGLDWSNVAIAGGLVLGLLLKEIGILS